MVLAAAVPDVPADALEEKGAIITNTATTYILPEAEYVKAEGPVPWVLHKLAVAGSISLAWLLLSSVAALAGEVRYLSHRSGRNTSSSTSGLFHQASKLDAEMKELTRENAKLKAQGNKKHAKAWKQALNSLKRGDRTLCIEAELLRMSNKKLHQRVQALRQTAGEQARERDDNEAMWMQTFENAYLKKSHGMSAYDNTLL